MRVLTPSGSGLIVFAPQSPSACQGCLCRAAQLQADVLQRGRSEHRPPALCLGVRTFQQAVLFCFAVANRHFFLCRLEQQKCWLVGTGAAFPSALRLSELLLHCSHPVSFAFCGISISLQQLVQCTLTLWMCFISPEPSNNRSNVFFFMVSAFIVNKYQV